MTTLLCQTPIGPALDWHGPTAAERRQAAAVCLRCPAVIQCATLALARREPCGVWGGLDLDPNRPAKCGTVEGYHGHLRHSRTPCPACVHAMEEEVTRTA